MPYPLGPYHPRTISPFLSGRNMEPDRKWHHTPTPSQQTNRFKNITFQQLRFVVSNNGNCYVYVLQKRRPIGSFTLNVNYVPAASIPHLLLLQYLFILFHDLRVGVFSQISCSCNYRGGNVVCRGCLISGLLLLYAYWMRLTSEEKMCCHALINTLTATPTSSSEWIYAP